MLRISKVDIGAATTFRLDGSLSGVWIEELRRLCEVTSAADEAITLDCGGISFSDREGIALIQELLTRRVVLTNCSPLLKFQLESQPKREA